MKRLDKSSTSLLLLIAMTVVIVGLSVVFLIHMMPDNHQYDLKTLGSFDFNDMTGTINDVPMNFRQLDGKKISLEGFIYCGAQAGDKISRFQFIDNIYYDSLKGPLHVQDRVFVFVPNNKTVEYNPDRVCLFGTLHVNVSRDEGGRTVSIYTMDLDHVEPLR